MATKTKKRTTPRKSTSRKEPGTRGAGSFFRIELRPKEEFEEFRNQDVGRSGGLERLAGKRSNGKWDTVTWLVSKEIAHRDGDTLVIDDARARTALRQIGSRITHKRGDVFTAKPRRTAKIVVTDAQRAARRRNIKKAQAARWKNR